LHRALKGYRGWITGLRRDQSPTRQEVMAESWDDSLGLMKLNPLATWSSDEVWAYIQRHQVPYNALHDQGYASIGCAPCTRALRPGEQERDGRWWWEQALTKECGLHQSALTEEATRVKA
jgi:phosphoadenosine phosphosulfate reductase